MKQFDCSVFGGPTSRAMYWVFDDRSDFLGGCFSGSSMFETRFDALYNQLLTWNFKFNCWQAMLVRSSKFNKLVYNIYDLQFVVAKHK